MRSTYSPVVHGLVPRERRAISCSTRASASCSKSASGRGSTTVAMSGHLSEGLSLRPGEESGGGLGELSDGLRRRVGDGDGDRGAGLTDDEPGERLAVDAVVVLAVDRGVVQGDVDPAVDVSAHDTASLAGLLTGQCASCW